MFPEKDKQIFPYDYKGRTYFADPLQVRRKFIQASFGEIDQILRDASETFPWEPSIDPRTGEALPPMAPIEDRDPNKEMQREQAEQRRFEVVCQVFELPPFDPLTGEGTREEEAIAILVQWLEWIAKKKRPAANSVTY